MELDSRSSLDDDFSVRGGSRRSASIHGSPRAPLEEQQAEQPQPAQYRLLVDSEGKAKQIKLYSVAPPHMLAFWVNAIAFATAFLATFAAAPLISIIRDDLNLTKTTISVASIASITGTCFARIVMGSFCDMFGPRLGHAMLLSLTSAPTFLMAVVDSGAGFVIVRCCIGFNLACFVCCQYWTAIMFSPTVVGTANALAGGIGNSGGGWTQIIMPYLTLAIANNVPEYQAWRWAFFVPGAAMIIISVLVLSVAQDLPDGNYVDLKRRGNKAKSNPKREMWVALRNYRTWVLVACYGFSFGVELTINNNLASYLSSQFGKSILAAGNFTSVFGLANLVARPIGGFMSDFLAKHAGMRGRLFWMWACLAVGAAFCIGLGVSQDSFPITMVMIVFFAFFMQAGCGAVFGVVPFVSRRALGVVCGAVGAGGNFGGIILQAAFFTGEGVTAQDSYKYMGIVSLGVTASAWLIWFPMWGGMGRSPCEDASEQDYYYADWTEDEQAEGLHLAVSKFANESRSQRGIARLKAEAQAQAKFESRGYGQA